MNINIKRKAYSYIRMSTEAQLKGDSKHRQFEMSEIYSRDHDLELVQSLDGIELHDIGVSAYKGKNVQEGSLGRFLTALRAGRIESGSLLLVESLDRLSRDKIFEALAIFMEILTAGIEVVTLIDGKHYTKGNCTDDQTQLIFSLLIMFRANEESETKSKRLKAVWSHKRSEATNSAKPTTSICPKWLKLSADRTHFEPIPDRVEVVRQIFQLCASTCGLYGIVSKLNGDGVKPFAHGKMWHRSYVHKIIFNRATLGEYQPHEHSDGKKIPSGDPIAGYYPAIISEEEFNLASVAVRRRDQNTRGRKGADFSNLFAGLFVCDECGAKMMMRSRGEPPKGGRYIVCSKRRANAGCASDEWRLDFLEEGLIRHFHELDFGSLLNDEKSAITALTDSISALTSKRDSQEAELNSTIDLSINPALLESLKVRYIAKANSLGLELQSLDDSLALMQQELAEQRNSEKLIQTGMLKSAILELDQRKEDYHFRSAVNEILRRTITSIHLGSKPFTYQPYEYTEDSIEVKTFRQTAEKRRRMPLREMIVRSKFVDHCRQFERYATVKYRSGDSRYVQFGQNFSLLNGTARRLTKKEETL
jgi:DNA invertase Pin-like site-specific DNA recombinase